MKLSRSDPASPNGSKRMSGNLGLAPVLLREEQLSRSMNRIYVVQLQEQQKMPGDSSDFFVIF